MKLSALIAYLKEVQKHAANYQKDADPEVCFYLNNDAEDAHRDKERKPLIHVDVETTDRPYLHRRVNVGATLDQKYVLPLQVNFGE